MVKGFWYPIERMKRLFHSLDLTYIQTSLISFVAQCKIDVAFCMQHKRKEMSAYKRKTKYEIWHGTCPVDPLVLENNPDQEITEAKSLERCLKKATLAWACTLRQTTAFDVLLPECGEILV